MYFLFTIIFLLHSCNKKDSKLVGTPDVKDSKLEIIWKSPIVEDTLIHFALGMNPCIYDSLVVFNTDNNYLGKGAPVLFMNKHTGQIVDSWSDYVEGPWTYRGETTKALGDYLILSSISSIDCLNLKTRQSQWSERFNMVGPYIYLNDGYVYTGTTFNANTSAAVIRTRPDQNSWDTLYKYTSTDGYKPQFDGINFGEMANGDKVLVWKNRSLKWSRDRTEIFAYNLSADTLLWHINYADVVSGAAVLQVDDMGVYGMIHKKLFALDLQDGSVLWERDFRGLVSDPGSANMDAGIIVQRGDTLVLKGDTEQLLYLNKKVGSLLQSTDLAWGNPAHSIETFEGNYYITTTTGLFIVEAQSGTILFTNKDDPRFNSRHIKSRVTIDPESRLMYFQNGRHAFCAKIPEGI